MSSSSLPSSWTPPGTIPAGPRRSSCLGRARRRARSSCGCGSPTGREASPPSPRTSPPTASTSSGSRSSTGAGRRGRRPPALGRRPRRRARRARPEGAWCSPAGPASTSATPALAMAAACEARQLGPNASRRRTASIVGAALGLVFAEAGLLCVSREGGILAVAASTVAELPAAVDGRGPSLLDLGARQRRAPHRRRPDPVGAAGAPRPPPGRLGRASSRPGPLALALVRERPRAVRPRSSSTGSPRCMRVAAATLGLHEARPSRDRLRRRCARHDPDAARPSAS